MKPILESINYVLETMRVVYIDKNLSEKEGRQKVIKKVMKEFGGDYRGATYNPKTGKGTVI